MSFEEVINRFSTESTLLDKQVNVILNDVDERNFLVKYLRKHPKRRFALAFLEKVLHYRKSQNYDTGSNENIMFSCYLVGLHKNVEDSLKVWKAKNVDFDSYCGIDVQLIAFTGINKTLEYLRTINSEESNKAIDYLNKCKNAGDFSDLENYYSEHHQPWWI